MCVGRKRVARLMRAAGLQGVSRRKRPRTTIRQPAAWPAPDLVKRDFAVARPNELWVADITYISTWTGFLYPAVVVDAWSRRVVGWAMATHVRNELVLDALEMAIRQRRSAGVIHHSGQGSQYTSIAFGKRWREAGVRPSMGSVADCFDNALCESFFATLECELLDRAIASARRGRLSAPCSSSRRDGTTRIGDTHLSAMHRPSGTRSHRPMECESPKPLPVH